MSESLAKYCVVLSVLQMALLSQIFQYIMCHVLSYLAYNMNNDGMRELITQKLGELAVLVFFDYPNKLWGNTL